MLGHHRSVTGAVAAAAVAFSLYGVAPVTTYAGDPVVRNYIVPIGDGGVAGSYANCTGKATTPQGDVGGGCFTVDGSQGGTVDLTVVDSDPLGSAAVYAFYSAGAVGPANPDPRNVLSSAPFCGSVKDVAMPAKATQLWVYVGVVNEQQAFPVTTSAAIGCGKPTPGSKGKITAVFSNSNGAAPAAAPVPVAGSRRVSPSSASATRHTHLRGVREL